MKQIVRSSLTLILLGALGAALAAQRLPAAGPTVTLTPAQRARLKELGWPPAPPTVPARDDILFRRDGPPTTGSLSTLHNFATVAMSSGNVQVPRDQISFVFVNGGHIPNEAPLLPLDSDAVVLTSGNKVLKGHVDVDGESIIIAGQTVQQSDVAFIHLRDPKAATGQQGAADAGGASSSGPGNPTGATSASGAGAATGGAATGGAGARPQGPDKIPWGQAMWRGMLTFQRSSSALNTATGQFTLQETEHGSYYITWAESIAVGRAPAPAMIKLKPVSLVYHEDYWQAPGGACPATHLTKEGSGFDGVVPSLHSQVLLQLPMRFSNNDAGRFQVSVNSPARISAAEIPKTCSTGGAPYRPLDQYQLPDFSNTLFVDCTSTDTTFHAPSPYITIATEIDCRRPGVQSMVRWQFDRGVPPINMGPMGDPCETTRGLLSLSQDQRRAAAERLRQIGTEFSQAKDAEARARGARDQLQPAFDLLIVAAAGSDLGQSLLEIATGDGMLKTAAAAGEITVAQQEFISTLNSFIKSYETWTKFADDPGGWGKSKLMGQAQSTAIGSSNQEILDAAMQLVSYGRVLRDAIGQGDGKAALDYIEEHLGALGPLVPDYAISKGRQYVEVSRQWADALKTMARLSGEGARLAGQIAEADLGIAVHQQELQNCK